MTDLPESIAARSSFLTQSSDVPSAPAVFIGGPQPTRPYQSKNHGCLIHYFTQVF